MAQDLSIRIRVEGRDSEGAVRRLATEFTGLQANVERTARASASATASLARMGHAAAAFAAINISAKGIQQAVDGWASLNAQLNIAAGSAKAGAAAYSDVLRIATSTGQSLEQVGTVYRRFAENACSLGMSMEQVASVSETVAKALALSGGSAESARAALVQFGQALSSGQLRGEELNSVLEQAPRLARALADGLGEPVGKLRAMAEAGDLTSEALVRALGKAAESVSAEFDQLPLTIGRALQNVQTAFTDTVGRFEEGTGLFRGAAEVIATVAQHMDVAAVAASALGGVMAGHLAKGFVASTAAKVADTLATMRAQQAAVAATAASQAFATAKLAEAQASIAAASGMQRLALVQSQLIPAQNALTQATVAATAARTAAATAANVGRVALGALGGPIGIVTTALTLGVTAWAMWGNKAEDATKQAADAATKHVGTVLEKLREMDARIGSFTRRQVESSIQNAMDARTENAIEQDMRSRRVGELREEVNFGLVRREAGGYWDHGLEKKIAQLREEESKYQTAVSRGAELQKTYESLNAQRVNAGIEDVRRFTDAHATGAAKVRADKERVLADFAKVIGNSARGVLDLSIPEHKAAFEALNGQLAEIDRRAKAADGSLRGAADAKRAAAQEAKTLAAVQAEAAGLTASFAEQWDALSRAFQAGKFGEGAEAVEQLSAAQARLLAQQPAIQAQAAEQKKAEKDAADATKERTSALQTLVSTESQRAASLEEANARAAEELATMGMTEQQLAAYTAAKYHAAAAADEQAAAELDVAAALLDQQQMLPEVAAQYRRLAAEKRRSAQANTEAAGLAIERANAEAAQAVNEEWQRSAGYIESSIYDAIVAGGVDGAELLKRTINSLILQPAVRMVVQGGTNAVMGMMGGGGAGGVAGIGGIGGSSGGGGINGIPGMGSMIGGGLVSLGGAIGMTTGVGGFLGSMGGAMSAGLGGFSGSMSAAYASMQAGATASAAGYAIGAVMPYIAAIIAIASAVGAFKGPTYHSGAAVMTGTDDSQATLRHKEAVGDDTRVWGGFTETSAKGGGQYAESLKELGKSVANTIEGTLTAFGVGQQVSVYTAFGADGDDKSRGAMRVYDAAGNLLGANSDQALRGAKYSKDPSKGFAEFADDAGRVIRDALVAADLPAWVDDVLTGLGDAPGIELVGTALGQIETLRTMGEQVGPMLALTAEQMAGLAPAAGGLEAVIATLSGYAEATLTDAERYAIAGAQLQAMRDRIADLGFTVPTTIEEFRALTDGIDIATEAGRELRMEMMGLAPAFAASQAAVLSLIGTTREDLAGIIRAGLTGQATSEEVSARLEEAVVGGIQNAMAASVANQVADLMIAGIINPAVETLVMGGELNRAAMRAQLDAAVAEISARVAAFNAIISSVEVQDALGDLRISMRSIATTVTPVTRTVSSATSSMASAASSAANRMRDAEEALRSAYQSRADELRATIDQFDDFARSLREFRESLYIGADSPLSLSARTAEAERQFRAVGAQARLGDLDAMGRLSAVGSDYLAAQRDSAASALDYARAVALVSGTAAAAEGTAQRQADVAREQLSLLDRTVSAQIKIDDSVLSVEQAIRDYLAVDKGGAARLRAAGIPGYASGGHHTGGLRIVGERGPELEATGPARIWSADQTRKLFAGDGDLLTELQALRREVAALRAESAATARHTHATSRTLERVTRGGRAMQVVEDAA